MKNQKNIKKVIALVGPTASGKTEISVNLAEKLGGEIISADSRLVYRDFNIGTAKPDSSEIRGIPHYMIDIEDPRNTFTAGKYKIRAEKLIDEILSRNKVPIIAGGTGFYIKSLLEGLDIPETEPDEVFREKMNYMVETEGKSALHELLQKTDSVSAQKLHPNDTFRVIRALEILHVTGKKMSEVQSVSEPKYNALYIGLNTVDREVLYNRINLRVLKMIEKGLVDEVKNLIEKYGRPLSLLRTLGYREICEYLEGLLSLDEAIEKIQKNTRNFAKRQLTWFRANPKILWQYIDKQNTDEICELIEQQWSNMLA